MEKKVIIPLAYQIVTDDIGWFNGDDDRCIEGPSRTGIPRRHVAEDYAILNEIGKAINQKILGAFVIGEWDKDNILRGMKHTTKDEDNWDMASQIDLPEAERCFEVMENGEYIEYALHGLMHGYWTDGISMADQEYFAPADMNFKGKYSNNLVPVSNEYFESHIETFYKIYESWGFKKKIRTFVSPSSMRGPVENYHDYAEILKKHGITYWSNNWPEVRDLTCVIDGMIFLNKSSGNCLPWNAFDVDPSILPDYDRMYFDGDIAPVRTIYSTHWPNFLRYNPLNNMEGLSGWVKFFKRQSEVFGVMISRDVEFAAHQAIYKHFTKITYGDNKIILDFKDVDTSGAIGVGNTMYISFRNNLVPDKCLGGTMSIYETHDLFKTYKIERTGETAEIMFK